MGNALKILPNYTYNDYLRWEGRWEIIDGIAYDMSPMASPKHQKISAILSKVFLDATEKDGCDCYVYQPIDIKISENTVVNPDLLVICEEVKEQYYDKPPQLVVEIISPFSKLKDTITKYDLYENFGVAYYIIIDPDEKSIKSFVLDNGLYCEMNGAPEYRMDENCVICPDLNQIFD